MMVDPDRTAAGAHGSIFEKSCRAMTDETDDILEPGQNGHPP
jgi:hypothetical protein